MVELRDDRRDGRPEEVNPRGGTKSLSFSRLDVSRLRLSLQRLFTICPWDIALDSLWSSLDKPRSYLLTRY
jgi:hypothetical protein